MGETMQWAGLFGGMDTWQFAMIVAAALLVGFSKTGIGGVVMIVVPLLAAVFGGKASTGILLPMLIIGDTATATGPASAACCRGRSPA